MGAPIPGADNAGRNFVPTAPGTWPHPPTFYFGANNPPHPDLLRNANAYFGKGLGNGSSYVYDMRRPMLAQLDYQWAGTYPKKMWDPLTFYRGYPAAPKETPERLGAFLRSVPVQNELGYQNVLLTDKGVPVGGEPYSTPQYVFAGPIQAGYMDFVRPIADRRVLPKYPPPSTKILQSQDAALYGVYGGGPYSRPPLQPPGWATERGGIMGDWPLYQVRPVAPLPQVPGPGEPPQRADANPGAPVSWAATRTGWGAGNYNAAMASPNVVTVPMLPNMAPIQNPLWPWVLGAGVAAAGISATAFACSPKRHLRDVSTLGDARVTSTLDFVGCWKAAPWKAAQEIYTGYTTNQVERSFKTKEEALAWLFPEAQNGEENGNMNGNPNADAWISPNQLARMTMQNPLGNPMVGSGPGYHGYLNTSLNGMGSQSGYTPNPPPGGAAPGLQATPAKTPPRLHATPAYPRPSAPYPKPSAGNPYTTQGTIQQNPNGTFLAKRRVVTKERGIFCKLFPNSSRCGGISAAPHSGCRWSSTAQKWICPPGGAPARGPALAGNPCLQNPGVVPVGVYPQWSGMRKPDALARAVNPGGCASCAMGNPCGGAGVQGNPCGGTVILNPGACCPGCAQGNPCVGPDVEGNPCGGGLVANPDGRFTRRGAVTRPSRITGAPKQVVVGRKVFTCDSIQSDQFGVWCCPKVGGCNLIAGPGVPGGARPPGPSVSAGAPSGRAPTRAPVSRPTRVTRQGKEFVFYPKGTMPPGRVHTCDYVKTDFGKLWCCKDMSSDRADCSEI